MHQDTMSQLRSWISEHGLDAFLIIQPQNRSYLSKWFNDDTEGAGLLLVGQQQQVLLTNTLYKEIAENEATGWQVIVVLGHDYAPMVAELAAEHGWKKIGFESSAISYAEYEKISNAGEEIYKPWPSPTGNMKSFIAQEKVSLLLSLLNLVLWTSCAR